VPRLQASIDVKIQVVIMDMLVIMNLNGPEH
jgi:hypothetical protein